MGAARALAQVPFSGPPPATILSLDEKPSIQALSRKYPDLPMRPGQPVVREFDSPAS